MIARLIGTFLSVILLISCGTKTSSDRIKSISDTVKTAEIKEDLISNTDTLKVNDTLDYSDCIRGQAESVINKNVYPNAIFKLNSDNHTGTETIDFGNKEKLIIYNRGCEYFSLTFRFETGRFQSDSTDTIFWLEKAMILMKEIEGGLDAPLDIKGGNLALENFLKENKDYNLGDEIVYDDDFIRDFVILDNIQQVSENLYAVEISYVTGPL